MNIHSFKRRHHWPACTTISIYDTLSIFPLHTHNTHTQTHPTWRVLEAFSFVPAVQRPIYIAINTSTPSISTLTPNVLAGSLVTYIYISERTMSPFRRSSTRNAISFLAQAIPKEPNRPINPLSPSKSRVATTTTHIDDTMRLRPSISSVAHKKIVLKRIAWPTSFRKTKSHLSCKLSCVCVCSKRIK